MDFSTSPLEDWEATFSSSVKQSLHQKYRDRCVVCLQRLPAPGILCTRVIDESLHVSTAVEEGVMAAEYNPASEANGVLKCPTCHLAYFTPNLIAFSLPLPVLHYILRYILGTPESDRKPLREVFRLLGDWSPGATIDALPDTKPIEPYLGLFALVILNPSQLIGMELFTRHQPPVSILKGGRFIRRKSGAAGNLACIFDSLALTNNAPERRGTIPLSPEQPTFQHVRYWRIPVKMEAILVTLEERIGRKSYASEEITCTQNIFCILALQRSYGTISIPLSAIPEPGPPEHGSKAGPSGDGPQLSGKRKRPQSDDAGQGSQKLQGRARRAGKVVEARDPGSSGLQNESRPPGVHPNESSFSCPDDDNPQASPRRLGEREDEQGVDGVEHMEDDGLGELSAGPVGESEWALE